MPYSLVERIEQVQALKTGMGLQYLVDEAYRILGNPVLMINLNYQLLVSAKGVVSDDTLWNEVCGNGMFSEQTIEFFKTECFIDGVANSTIVSILKSDKLKYDRFNGRVFSKNNIPAANLVIVEIDKPFDAYDSVLFEAMCVKVSEELSLSEYHGNYAKTFQDNLISMLIDINITDKTLYAAHIANLYIGLNDYIYVCVASDKKCGIEQTKLENLRGLFQQMNPSFKYSVYSNYIVIIMSTDAPVFNAKRDLGKLYKCFKQKHIYAGISNGFDNIFEFEKYYCQAVEALNYGLEYSDNKHVFLYGETK